MPAKKMRFVVMKVSPVKAQNWLDNANIANRHIASGVVSRYAKDMARGTWGLTPECVAFDTNGRLIGGQHRLQAIVQSGVTIELAVAFDCPPEAQMFMDAGRKQSLADACKFYLGEDLTKRAEQVSNAMMDPSRKCNATRQDQMAFYEQHRNAIHFAIDLFRGAKRGIAPSGIVALVARASYSRDKQRLVEFSDAIKSGMVYSPSDGSAIELRDLLLARKQDSKDERRWLSGRAEYLLDCYLKRRTRYSRKEVARNTLFPIPGEEGYEAAAKRAA